LEPFLEEGTGRPRALWRLLFQYWAYKVAVPLLVNLLTVVWLLVRSGREIEASGELDASILSGSPALPLIGGIAALMGVLLSVWLAGRFLDRRSFADFGFHLSGGWWLDLLFGMALGALLMTLIFLVELGFGWITVTGVLDTLVTGVPFALAILPPTAVFLCVGVYEELLFRGYQLRNAAEGLNLPVVGPRKAVILAWILSSAFFGYLHANNPDATLLSTVNIALAGLMLGLGYVLTGELAIPIGLHITWNFFQGNVFGFPAVSGLKPVGATFLSTDQGGPGLWTGGPFGPEAGLLAPAAMILGSLLMALWVRLRSGKVGIHTPIAEGPNSVRSVGASSEPAAGDKKP
jgi:membrane protease YdiL (CAAX protease family)